MGKRNRPEDEQKDLRRRKETGGTERLEEKEKDRRREEGQRN